MASSIDPTKPVSGSPTTSSVRENFTEAASEINRLLRSSEEGGVTAGGSANALTAAFTLPIGVSAGVGAGNRILIKAVEANTGAVTLACDGGSALTLKSIDGGVLAAGEIHGASHYLDLYYNGYAWILLNPYPVSVSGNAGTATALETARTFALTGAVTGTSSAWSGTGNNTIATSFDTDAIVALVTSAAGAAAYPVSSIYITTSARNPSEPEGAFPGIGTWVAYGAGRVPVGVDASHTPSTTTGGALTVTVDTTIPRDGWGSVQSGGSLPEPSEDGRLITGSGLSEASEDLESLAQASGDRTFTSPATNIEQPWIAVYMWKRQA